MNYYNYSILYCMQLYENWMCAVLSCSVISDSLWPHGQRSLAGYIHGDSPGKNTGVGCHVLLQGIFPTQGSNPGLPHSGEFFTVWATREALRIEWYYSKSMGSSKSGASIGKRLMKSSCHYNQQLAMWLLQVAGLRSSLSSSSTALAFDLEVSYLSDKVFFH